MILLDTVTISETIKRAASKQVLSWLGRQAPESLFLSVVTLGEIERGIAKIERRDPAAARRLNDWVRELVTAFADRIIDFDLDCSLRWGRLVAELGRNDTDVLIGATAAHHGWAVATRNVGDFAGMGIDVINPWTA